jgi:predicted SAM-dependent methyltransferase
MSFHTLEHIYPDDATKFVKESLRVLKPGGHVIISIPYERAYPDPAHVAFYNVESLTKLFEDNGFDTIECMKDNRWPEQKDLLTGVFNKPV